MHRSVAPIAGIVASPSGHGYWLVGQDGGVFAFGDGSTFFGPSPSHFDAMPGYIVGVRTNRRGYWRFGSDGSVFAYKSAGFYGSMGNHRLNTQIVGMTTSRDGNGYWLVGADGGVFAFGDAAFSGSAARAHSRDPFVGIHEPL